MWRVRDRSASQPASVRVNGWWSGRARASAAAAPGSSCRHERDHQGPVRGTVEVKLCVFNCRVSATPLTAPSPLPCTLDVVAMVVVGMKCVVGVMQLQSELLCVGQGYSEILLLCPPTPHTRHPHLTPLLFLLLLLQLHHHQQQRQHGAAGQEGCGCGWSIYLTGRHCRPRSPTASFICCLFAHVLPFLPGLGPCKEGFFFFVFLMGGRKVNTNMVCGGGFSHQSCKRNL